MSKKSLPKQLLSAEEQAECRKLAEVFVEQMRDNAGKICGKDKGIRFSPRILRMALSVYVRSPVGYEELKKSSLEIFPSCSTIARMKQKMNTKDGICPRIYQWFFDEKIRHLPAKERIGQLMCDEMHLKAGVYWNTKSHRIAGFASESTELNLCEEIKSLEKDIDANGELRDASKFHESNRNATKVNQWRFRSIKGVVHNG